jgi:hypothetical protein
MVGLMANNEYTHDALQESPKHDEFYQSTYTHYLEALTSKCVQLNPSNRPTLHSLLVDTRVGLEKWERGYGKVGGRDIDDLPEYAKVEFVGAFKVGIGGFMGDAWRAGTRSGLGEEDAQPKSKRQQVLQKASAISRNGETKSPL